MSQKEETRLNIFNNEEFGTIRVIVVDGEPWFIGKDIAIALGYKNSRVAIQDNVDVDDKGVTKVTTSGGAQDTVVINESGLYSLVFGSKLETAKRFKHWVTSEILPSIRKRGVYMTDEIVEKTITDPDFIIQLATELKEERNRRVLLEKENASLLPDAELARDVIKYTGLYTLKEVADLIELGRTELCTLLRIKKVLSKQAGYNIPLNKYIKQGYFKIKLNDKYSTSVTLVTARGLKFIYRLIKKCDLLDEFDTDTLLEVAKETSME